MAKCSGTVCVEVLAPFSELEEAIATAFKGPAVALSGQLNDLRRKMVAFP